MFYLTIPYILLVLIVVDIILLYKRRWIIAAILGVGCLWLNYYCKTFTFGRLFTLFTQKDGIKVLCMNLNGTLERSKSEKKELADFLLAQDADVLFLAEDFETIAPIIHDRLIKEYPYSSYPPNIFFYGHYFYSRYPIGEVEHLKIESNQFSFCYHVNVAYNNDSISVFGVHLASNNYIGAEPSIRPDNINGWNKFELYADNISKASHQRSEELTNVLNHTSKVAPTIILGDFNDVCGSQPLNFLNDSGYKDAWWVGGFGYGATICHPLPFRIDHIMYNGGMKLKNIQKIKSQGLSDHDALVAIFEN